MSTGFRDAREKRFTEEALGPLTGKEGWVHTFMDSEPTDILVNHRQPRSEKFAHHLFKREGSPELVNHLVRNFDSREEAQLYWKHFKLSLSERRGCVPLINTKVDFVMEVRGPPEIEQIRATLGDEIAFYEGPTQEWLDQPGLLGIYRQAALLTFVGNFIVLRGNEIHKINVQLKKPTTRETVLTLVTTLMRDYALV